MRKAITVMAIGLVLGFSSLCFGGIVDDARTKLTEEKRASNVAKARSLLKKQDELSKELLTIKDKLAKLDAGEDVDVEEANPLNIYGSSSSNVLKVVK